MFGLIGKKLSHSFSKEIHEILSSESYNLIELSQLDSFFQSKQFKGLNVTIPYKEDVIKHIDVKSDIVIKTNSVNTIINKDGLLYGYNTDYEGLRYLLEYNDISVKGKTVLVLGNGATSRTVELLCHDLGAKKIIKAARSPKGNDVSLNNVREYNMANIIINATPSGMYPNNYDDLIIKLEDFINLQAVVDLVYNPLKTRLIIKAISMDIIAVNGLMMLVRQAVKSCELFHNLKFNDSKTIKIYNRIVFNMINIVLIGMPMSGKSRYARALSNIYNKKLIDIDKMIIRETGMNISKIFETSKEEGFRLIETNTLMKISKGLNQVVSTGGGVVVNAKNIDYLKQNGIIIFLDVPIKILEKMSTKDRPLLNDINNLTILYNDRHQLYLQYADIVINKNNLDDNHILNMIEVKIDEYINTKWS